MTNFASITRQNNTNINTYLLVCMLNSHAINPTITEVIRNFMAILETLTGVSVQIQKLFEEAAVMCVLNIFFMRPDASTGGLGH